MILWNFGKTESIDSRNISQTRWCQPFVYKTLLTKAGSDMSKKYCGQKWSAVAAVGGSLPQRGQPYLVLNHVSYQQP